MFFITNVVVIGLVIYFVVAQSDYSGVKPKNNVTPEEHYGFVGEQEVVDTLNKSFGTYKVMRNLYLPHPFEKGETTEIDMLLIHHKGIIVFEAKNWSGEITGGDKDKFWYAESTGDKSLYNPLKQNAFHELALRKLIPAGYCDQLSSVVVFGSRSDISGLNLNKGNDKRIVHQKKLETFMFLLGRKKVAKFALIDMENLVDQLTPFVHVEKKVKQKHVKRIVERYGE